MRLRESVERYDKANKFHLLNKYKPNSSRIWLNPIHQDLVQRSERVSVRGAFARFTIHLGTPSLSTLFYLADVVSG